MTRDPRDEDFQLVHLRLEQSLLERLDDYRFAHRFESRTAAARWLLEWALDQNPDPKRKKR